MAESSMPEYVQQKHDELQAIMYEGIGGDMNEGIGEESLITLEQAMRKWAQEHLPGFTVDKVEIRDGTAYISMSGGE